MEIRQGEMYWVMSIVPKDIEKHGPHVHRLTVVIWELPNNVSKTNLYVVGQLGTKKPSRGEYICINKYLGGKKEPHGYVRPDNLRILSENEITLDAIAKKLKISINDAQFKMLEVDAFKMIRKTRRWELIRKIIHGDMKRMNDKELKEFITKGQFSNEELKQKGFK